MARESKTPINLTTRAGGELVATGPVLARWLGISGKAVYELAKMGILMRVSRDQFLLEESVRRYCDHIRHVASPHEASQSGGANQDQTESINSEL